MKIGSAAPVQKIDASQDEVQQARDWWGARELDVERKLVTSLQHRMEVQRAQIHAFKTEQSKWEHELQLRISKYAHDRKLLSEQNVELQEKLKTMENNCVQYQREMDQQVQHVIELEGMLHVNQIDAQQIRKLQDKNKELNQRLRQQERTYSKEKLNFARDQKTQQEEMLTELEHLLTVSKQELMHRQEASVSSDRGIELKDEQAWQATRRRTEYVEDDALVTRIKKLEVACEQKDQAICSLKGVVELQETTFDEKIKIVTAKYNQIKAINLALQKRVISALKES